MNETQVSIIFVNYNSKDMSIDAINSVFEKTKNLNFEIIVVDNGSNDGSIEALQKTFGNKIKIIKSNLNLGPAKGNNIGIENSKGKYILLLNTDMLLMNNVAKILYDFIEQNPTVGVCGGNLYDRNGNPTYSCSINFLKENESALINVLKSIRKKITGKLYDSFNYSNKNKRVDHVIGTIMMIRKEALNKSGLFDKDFFMYQEEPELINRIEKNGYSCYSVPQAKAIHFACKSFNNNEKRFRLYTYGAYLYYEKVYGIKAVKVHYKERLRFTALINIISLGLYRKECSFRKRIMKEEYNHWLKEIQNGEPKRHDSRS